MINIKVALLQYFVYFILFYFFDKIFLVEQFKMKLYLIGN